MIVRCSLRSRRAARKEEAPNQLTILHGVASKTDFQVHLMGAIMWNAIRFFAGMAFAAAALVGIAHTATRARATEVDLLLTLAVDVSRSVDQQQFNLQRDGYAAAMTNPRVIRAIRSGRLGRIAVCYIEWSGSVSQKLQIDWTVVGDAASARGFASELAEAPRSFADLTSISAGIDEAQVICTNFEPASRFLIEVQAPTYFHNPAVVETDFSVMYF
jgi:hypothetical protein